MVCRRTIFDALAIGALQVGSFRRTVTRRAGDPADLQARFTSGDVGEDHAFARHVHRSWRAERPSMMSCEGTIDSSPLAATARC